MKTFLECARTTWSTGLCTATELQGLRVNLTCRWVSQHIPSLRGVWPGQLTKGKEKSTRFHFWVIVLLLSARVCVQCPPLTSAKLTLYMHSIFLTCGLPLHKSVSCCPSCWVDTCVSSSPQRKHKFMVETRRVHSEQDRQSLCCFYTCNAAWSTAKNLFLLMRRLSQTRTCRTPPLHAA